jgi:hypothetical protein
MKTALLVGIFAFSAHAADAETITITPQTCAQLTRHTPRADVEYRPGQDVVNGKKVVPADLSDTPPIKVPENFDIAITVELAHTLGIPAFPDPARPERDLYKPEANIGTVSYLDGRAYFNGQPIQGDAEAELSQLCQRVRAR